MRISDWSSDVCSSDLQIAERQHPRDGQVGKPEGRGDVGDVAALLHQPGEGLPLCHLVGVEPRQILDHRRLDGGGIVGSARMRQGSGSASPVSCATIRSEEHTSELQSLMRISYAVFCLKKKNKRPY